MKIKLWLIVVSLVFVQGCTGVLLSSLNSKSGDGSSGLMNLLILLGLGGAAGGDGSGNGSAATVNYTPVATYDLSSGIPAGWTGTWTSTSSNCPATGTAPCLRSAVLGDSQSSSLSFVTNLATASKISFKRRVSSELDYDRCLFTIDGVAGSGEGQGITGTEDRLYEFTFSASATRTFAWTYSKDISNSNGLDMCSLDDVVLYSQAYTIGGTVSGLTGSGLVLINNGADDKTITINGSFTFATAVASGSNYSVTVKTQPSGQTCNVSNGAGTVNANVTNVSVVCSAIISRTIGGSVSGLTGTVVLQNNTVDDKTITTNGSFTFSTPIASGSTYSVSVKTQPSGQACAVSNGSGTANANVTNVSVVCSAIIYRTIGGSISGLTGTVVLQNNTADDKIITANGSFTFTTGIASGSDYFLTVKTQPSGQVCSISNGSGTANANVTNVSVSCSAVTYFLLKTGQTTSYATGDDGAYQSGIALSYTDNNDGTIRDNATGLTWQKCSQGRSGTNCGTGTATTSLWVNAGTYCSSLSLASKTWRLPTLVELSSLVDAGRNSAPTVNITAFPATQSSAYWSSTIYAANTSLAWIVYFNVNGNTATTKTNNFYIRCVSGP